MITPQEYKFISVIIPVRNAVAYIRQCIEAVLSSDYRHYECIIIDDASEDNTLEIIRHYPIEKIKLSHNHGPSFARNKGAHISKGDILLFIDVDVVINLDTLSKIASFFYNKPEVVTLFGSYDDEPADTSFISQYKNLFHH